LQERGGGILIEVVLMLIASMVIVFIAAMLFVNAIEYLGFRLELGGSFVGAILAPLFTSFPELIVFLVAVFAYTGEAGEEIGIGTVFGQPFMASSLSYGLVGLVVIVGYYLKKRDDLVLEVDKTLVIPYAFISVLFPLTIVPAIIGGHHLFGLLFLASYVGYIWMMYKRRMAETIEDAEMPYACGIIKHPLFAGFIQLFAAVVLLYIGSERLVSSVDILARNIGISPLGLALIIVPAATAIPETTSALIWGYRGKDTLCMGSLVGEKILYSTLYPGLGLLLTSWEIDYHAYLSVAATTIISFVLLYYIAKQRVPWYVLFFGLFFFIGYATLIFVYHM
jgi:cation:H+ antiporter